MKLKIGIEAQRLFRSKKHGMDIVALELIRHLQRIDTHNEYYIFVKPDKDNQVITPTSNFHIVEIPGGPYPFWEQFALPAKAKSLQLDILHCTSNTAPLKACAKKLIVTLHDIIYLEKVNLSQGTSYQIIGNLYRRWNVPKMMKIADRIFTVSDFEKARINNHFGLQNDLVKTVYNSSGEHFKKVSDSTILKATREKYGLPDAYMFFLGNTDPKKNVIGVMKALSILKKANALTMKLVMLDINRDYFQSILKEVGDPDLANDVHFCGYVPNAEMPALYSGASIFLYPSLRESFGIPILEAMSCGLPVITSETSSMPEVAGKAAVYCNPFVPQTIADAIIRLQNDATLVEYMKLKSVERAAEFSWERNARETLAEYMSLCTA